MAANDSTSQSEYLKCSKMHFTSRHSCGKPIGRATIRNVAMKKLQRGRARLSKASRDLAASFPKADAVLFFYRLFSRNSPEGYRDQ